MIFIVLGTQKFQLNRLLKEVDQLIAEGVITEEVLAQIGNSDYVPKHYKYFRFINKQEFDDYIKRASLVLTHGGVGSIISALKTGKPVVVYPRLRKYQEHVDDHQLDIARAFEKRKYVLCCYEDDALAQVIKRSRDYPFDAYVSNTDHMTEIIKDFLKKKGIEGKVCLTASSGGHLEEISRLAGLANQGDFFLTTEKGGFGAHKFCRRVYFLSQMNRRELFFLPKFLKTFFQSFYILLKERPACIISTGALATFPLSLMGKLLGKKLIYIESFARVDTASLTGKLTYRFADLFIVQWETLLRIYPKAIYGGSIF